jgi:hypothetical protein
VIELDFDDAARTGYQLNRALHGERLIESFGHFLDVLMEKVQKETSNLLDFCFMHVIKDRSISKKLIQLARKLSYTGNGDVGGRQHSGFTLLQVLSVAIVISTYLSFAINPLIIKSICQVHNHN